ncbi:MAG: hypothetical protein KDA61_13890, partial [Planctomycetales bacterium]|nr:hypothetical protein [Planctomycetales bacterium]
MPHFLAMRSPIFRIWVCALVSLGGVSFSRTSRSEQSTSNESRVRLVLIGDSTVRNGRGLGEDRLWGWGQVLASYFDATRIQVENRAVGGRSSRTFLTEGLWDKSLERLKPGDFVLIQFGHNDGGEKFIGNRPRASIPGNGDETVDGVVEMTGKSETVHSYGWYLRRYIAEAKAKGAMPIVLSLVPRNRWENDQVIRSTDSYVRWAREAAEQGGAPFIDLNELAATAYERLGPERVAAELFTADDWTHTTQAGAIVNASCVVAGIRDLAVGDLALYLADDPSSPAQATQRTAWRFDFGAQETSDDAVNVSATDAYDANRGYGFENAAQTTIRNVAVVTDESAGPLRSDACAADHGFYFSAAVPEGNYRVRVLEPSPQLTVKAELRRLMIDGLQRRAKRVEFTVNVRSRILPNGATVKLKPREKTDEIWSWDERLTLEFNGPGPSVAGIEVFPDLDAPTIFLTGDSIVTDQPHEPWNSWGQMLPLFFKPGIAVANYAQSGESIRSSLGARRFDKIYSLMRQGDFLLCQFG